MSKIINFEELNDNFLLKCIKDGKIVVYPTDTVYGLGCNATDEEAVSKVRMIKKSNKPFSVIAPSKQWIYSNLNANKTYVQKLPGPFTFVFKIRKPELVAPSVTNTGFLGVRIPDHKITKVLQKSKLPIVTTSANISGKRAIRKIKDIPKKMLKHVDVIIDGGELGERPSVVLDLTEKVVKIIKR